MIGVGGFGGRYETRPQLEYQDGSANAIEIDKADFGFEVHPI